MEISIATATATAARVAPRRRIGAFAAAARTLALTMVLLFSAGAQADPAVAQNILQTIRTERQVFDVHMRMVNYYLDVSPGNAQISLMTARIDAIQIGAKLADLQAQNKDSRANGQYNDLQALERAIQQGDAARNRIRMVENYLMILQMEQPPSAMTRQLLNVQLQMFEMYMRELELAMSQA